MTGDDAAFRKARSVLKGVGPLPPRESEAQAAPRQPDETGPCVRCQQPTTRYGDNGRPHCDACIPFMRAAAGISRLLAASRPKPPEPRAPGVDSAEPEFTLF